MWADLDPDAVEAEAERINGRPELERTTTKLPEDLRQRLAAGGTAALMLLQTLDPRETPQAAPPSSEPEIGRPR
jgi:hypothetical protein